MIKSKRYTWIAAWIVFLLVCPLNRAAAQDITAGTGYSPYSLFGFGDPVRQGSTYNLSMAGIGIGDRNVRFLNYLNPAAVTAREARSFMFDFGLESRNMIYQGNAATAVSLTSTGVLKSADNSFNMHHIVASFPIAGPSAFKVGVVPYSTVHYDFQADETSDELLAEVGDIRYFQQGRGGLYQAFLGAGVTLWNRLSLGADLDYYFGSIDRYSKATFTTNTSYRAIVSGWTDNVSCFGGKVGLQYAQPLGGSVVATLGATYAFSSKLRGGEKRYALGVGDVTDTLVLRKYSLDKYACPLNWAWDSRCVEPTAGWWASIMCVRTGPVSSPTSIPASTWRWEWRTITGWVSRSRRTATTCVISCVDSPIGRASITNGRTSS